MQKSHFHQGGLYANLKISECFSSNNITYFLSPYLLKVRKLQDKFKKHVHTHTHTQNEACWMWIFLNEETILNVTENFFYQQQPCMEKGIIYYNKFQKLVTKRRSRRFWNRVQKGNMVQLLTHPHPSKTVLGSQQIPEKSQVGEGKQISNQQVWLFLMESKMPGLCIAQVK